MKFYQKTWFMWVMLILLPPVGIFIMWKLDKYSEKTRYILSTIFGLIFIISLSNKNFVSTLTLILFLIGCAGFLFSLIYLLINVIKKSDKKKFATKLVGGFAALAIVSMFVQALNSSLPSSIPSNSSVESSQNASTKSISVLTDSDKALLKKSYKDFSSTERTQFAEIEEKYKKMSDSEKESIKSNFDRLSKERDEQVAQWKAEEEAKVKAEAEAKAKQWQDFVAKNTKKLSAGEHTIGSQIDKGLYDVTFNGSGNFTIYDSDGKLITNEIGGASNLGITKYRAILPDGGSIKLSGLSINVKPVQQSLIAYGTFNLYSGYWYVGKDITKGRYKITPVKGSGNFFVYDSSGYPKANEILGGDYGVKEYVMELKDGDLINIASLESVEFEPSN